MRKFILRILKTLSRLKVIGKIVTFTYNGPGVSLNKFYSQGHWRIRQAIKEDYKKIFDKIINEAVGKIFFSRFYLVIFYNSRHDCDNVVGMEKLFIDCLKGKLITNDGKLYYAGLTIIPDMTLPKNTFEFVLIECK